MVLMYADDYNQWGSTGQHGAPDGGVVDGLESRDGPGGAAVQRCSCHLQYHRILTSVECSRIQFILFTAPASGLMRYLARAGAHFQ